ncbi:MAG: type II secretion system F family protein [Candidatus Nanopelagicaceae bacterium]|nr:type II secretion system F family protein [Candidatus Nanopelagicaceae bacterium]
MNPTLFQSESFLSLLVVAPLLFWGVWIASVESFDELNSTNLILKKMESGGRSTRKALLPFYFLVASLGVAIVAVAFFTKGDYLIPMIALSVMTSAFVTIAKRNKVKTTINLTKQLESELPAQIQLLTILISSGISPGRAIAILANKSESLSSTAFLNVVRNIEMGDSIIEALDKLKRDFDSNSLRRFVTSLILGIERGSTLGPILISQVRDARMASKSEIMAKAGKAEIGLMIPVVFLILPISILFALWPSYQQLGGFFS